MKTDMFTIKYLRGVDQIRNHIYNNNIEIEYFGYVKNHGFEDQKFKVLVCDDIRWGRCDIKSTSLLANTMMMNQAHQKAVMKLLCINLDILLRREPQIFSLFIKIRFVRQS
jgi:hypothetical protein